jgi:integrase
LIRPLSRAAQEIIDKQPEIEGSPFVFSYGKGPVAGFSKLKERLDQASGVTGWVIHDLRRSSRSLMSRAGVAPDVAERALGHVLPGIRAVYDQHRYTAEMRGAFEALAALVERILDPRQDTVVPLRPRAAGELQI